MPAGSAELPGRAVTRLAAACGKWLSPESSLKIEAEVGMNKWKRRDGALVAIATLFLARGSSADNFAGVYFDAKAGQLVVTMRYRGTNPDHVFTLKWGQCTPGGDGKLPEVSAEVLDDQWQDHSQRDFKKTTRFDLSGIPCRPAKVTLRTAPRFLYSVVIPG